MSERERSSVQGIDDLYAIGGLLADDNADGYPDDLRARIILECEPSAPMWCALLDLAARLGVETAGVSLPLVTNEPSSSHLPIVVAEGDAAEPEYRNDGWHGRPAVIANGVAAVRRLALAGAGALGSADQRPPCDRPIDLADLFESTGLLADADGDGAPDGTRLRVVVPDELPRGAGIALINFAARLGIESGGVDLPIAVTEDAEESDDSAIALRINLRPGEPATLSAGQDGTRQSLLLTGDPDSAADLLRYLAERWPTVEPDLDVGEVVIWLRRSLAGWTPEGRAAVLLANLDAVAAIPDSGDIRLLVDDPSEQGRLAHIVRERFGPGTTILGPGSSQVVFSHHWSGRWEVDRALDTLRERILPGLAPGSPAEVTIVVSEPEPVRRRLERSVREMLADHGFAEGEATVRVLDAFKTGLCWIREIVLPRWQSLGGIERIVMRFLPLTPPSEMTALDLRIRWLQELFPADEIMARVLGLPLDKISIEEWQGDATYALDAYDTAGNHIAHEEFSPPWYQRPYIGPFPGAGTVHVSTGGILARQGAQEIAARCPTDLDVFWDYFQGELLPALGAFILDQSEGTPQMIDQPFFDELRVEVSVSEVNEPFGIRQEWNSAAEALHEDIYFNTLDYVEELGRSTSGERLSAPGSVIPIVHVRPGLAPHAQITLRRRPHSVARLELGNLNRPIGNIQPALSGPATVVALQREEEHVRLMLRLAAGESHTLATLRALSQVCPARGGRPALEVHAGDSSFVIGTPATDQLPEVEPSPTPTPEGTIVTEANLLPLLGRNADRPEVRLSLAGRSYQGRPIPAMELTAPMRAGVWSSRKLAHFKPTFLIVGRHHANEVASTTAALMLIERLLDDETTRRLLDRVNVTILPYENPDGAALHEMLQREHPTWKHHPARYNAVGFEFGEDTFNPDSRYGEARVRTALWQRWLPDVVVDNHGVPSHEWAQVFAGFGSPPRFRVSYWQLQALIYGILHYLDDERYPEHRRSSETLREAVARAIAGDPELLAWNRIIANRYHSWGQRWEPERFPGELHREMLFHFGSYKPGTRAGRAYTQRAPRLTVVNWVTEVGDETAHGAHLARTARAHLIANLATLELLAAAAGPVERRRLSGANGSTRITVGRARPISLGG